MIFGISPLFALIPLVLYLILAFRDLHPVLNVVICVVVAAVMTKQSFADMGGVLAESLGSFLGMIGFIIMLGSGLGAILRATGVAEFIVYAFTKKIGVNTEKKAVLATMATSIVLVALLGTLAGANAIIAPMIIPMVAMIGLTPSTMAVVMMGAGMTGLFIGPYSPQVVTIMELTKVSYGTYLVGVGLPVAAICWIITYFMALRTQKKTKGVYEYTDVKEMSREYVATKESRRATEVFFLCMAVLIGYGIYLQKGASYSIMVIFVTAVLTGIAGGLPLNKVFDEMISGAAKMMWLFLMFVLFTPFIDFITKAGAFDALVKLMTPLFHSNSILSFTAVTTLTGVFGIGGAATAESVLLNSMFGPLVENLGVSATLWGTILLVSSQITSFAYPEADMLGQMGLARSKDMKSMVKFGITVAIACVIYVMIRAFFG
jgi:H+/gluconate symporter-like permease